MHRHCRVRTSVGVRGEGGEVRFAEDGRHVHTGVHRTPGTRVEQSAAWCPDSAWSVVTPAILNSRTCST